MKITFKNIEIHNFMSFTDSYITLNTPGYILVKGDNENPSDNSSSNGAGKSGIFEAILFCLTGETQRGISGKSVIKHGSKECSVTLSFSIDKDEYTLTRGMSPSQSLTIIKNGEDISGKGVTDSKKILEEQLPDLTMSLLSNLVILGQGLPNRFSLNSPSGRKDVLEKLFKADFMIEDIKTRIGDRLNELKDKKRSYEDRLLGLTTKKSIAEENITASETELATMEDVSNLMLSLDELSQEIYNLENQIKEINKSNKEIIVSNEGINAKILTLTENQIEVNNSDYLVKEIEEVKEKGLALKSEVIVLDKEIERKDKITDTCPTCGQRLVGVEKPDTSKEKELSMMIRSNLDGLRETLRGLQEKRQDKLNTELDQINEDILNLKSQLRSITDISSLESNLSIKRNEYTNIESEINIHDVKKKEIETNITKNKEIVDNSTREIEGIEVEKLKLEAHIDVDNKINSIIKRDFRGYLLSNIIELIDSKCKEFGQQLFGHTDIGVSQDGNNISITLNNKEYELLSGGEKQKLDLITQLAIRDVLIKYSGFNCSMLVLDEIFDNLDDIGGEKVLNLIANNLNIPSIYIISHHADIQIPYDSQIIVKKDSFGSRAIQL